MQARITRYYDDVGVLERRVQVRGSRFVFLIRRESWGGGFDQVVCFGGKRLLWCPSLRRAKRAVRLLDYLFNKHWEQGQLKIVKPEYSVN